MFAFLNNEFLPVEKAYIHVSDLAIQRGYGIFDFLKVRAGHPLFLNDYFDRFYNSASIMQLEVPLKREELKNVIQALLQKNNTQDCGMKLILTGGYSSDGYTISKPNFIITQQPLSLLDTMSAGVKVITHEYMREVPHVKSINYITGIITLQKMNQQGAADVLYHQQGVVSEFPRCNFFIVTKDKIIRTPDKNILEGVTRKNLLKFASKNYQVEEGTVTLEDAFNAKEAFLTNTTKRIIPIIQIDEAKIGNGKPGEVSGELYQLLVQLENQDIESSVL